MEFTAAQKEELEAKIVEIITVSLEQKKIEEADLPVISSFVLDYIDSIKTQEDLLNFLRHLSARWPIFEGLKETEKGKLDQKEDKEAVVQAEQLVEAGRIEEALQVAKTANNT